MLREKKLLPIGTEFFDELREKECYYVDKTGLIAELLRSQAKVTLFTRPRRFGKTLAMTTLKCFFEIGADPSLFEGLAISRERELCEQHLGKYPVVFVSLKSVDAANFTRAREQMGSVIARAAERLDFLAISEKLTDEDKDSFRALRHYSMTEQAMTDGLWTLCRLLEKHYGRKTVLLIDEYDVPLQKAFYAGYYDEMVGLIRNMFAQALKTNNSLERAVLTGCLRISKESIFTGMNNLQVFTVADSAFSDCFGFTDAEVRNLMDYYGLTEAYESAKEWYDGYRFGEEEIYCPWDMVNYIYDLLFNPSDTPRNFWANSSSNDAVREFVRQMDAGSARRELQVLADGGTVKKRIHQELTYREMYTTVENLWSLLYMTGYLTSAGKADEDGIPLTIPNREIRAIFTDQIMELFREETRNDGESLKQLCGAFAAGDAAGVEKSFGGYLRRAISIRDTSVRKARKENFYHGILMGLLAYKADWIVTSNREAGDGYSDILVEAEDGSLGIVIEVKYAEDGDLESAAQAALAQIETRRYDEAFEDEGIENVLKYGIACYKKRCRAMLGDG